MLGFEKMKKCKRFFEKTRKKFILLRIGHLFSKEKVEKGDFCFKKVSGNSFCVSNCQCKIACNFSFNAFFVIFC